jgi:hypothetical protein
LQGHACTHINTHTHNLSLSLSCSPAHTYKHALSSYLAVSHIPEPRCTCTHTHTHTLTHTLKHTHTHLHTYTSARNLNQPHQIITVSPSSDLARAAQALIRQLDAFGGAEIWCTGVSSQVRGRFASFPTIPVTRRPMCTRAAPAACGSSAGRTPQLPGGEAGGGVRSRAAVSSRRHGADF